MCINSFHAENVTLSLRKESIDATACRLRICLSVKLSQLTGIVNNDDTRDFTQKSTLVLARESKITS